MQKRHHAENTVFTGLYGQNVTTLISNQNQRCWVPGHVYFATMVELRKMDNLWMSISNIELLPTIIPQKMNLISGF